jgi:hypothetical protein
MAFYDHDEEESGSPRHYHASIRIDSVFFHDLTREKLEFNSAQLGNYDVRRCVTTFDVHARHCDVTV